MVQENYRIPYVSVNARLRPFKILLTPDVSVADALVMHILGHCGMDGQQHSEIK